MNMYTALLVLIVCSSYSTQGWTGVPTTHQTDGLTFYIDKLMKCRNVPALSITLVKGNSFVWSRGFGKADIENGLPATNRTRFCIGSLSKAFTSTILGKLLSQQQNITWDTPIRKILGDGFRFSDDLRTDVANLRDLLAHKMGVPSYFNAFMAGFPEDVTRSDLARRLQFMDATEPFRTNFMYNNYMYSLAGYIAEMLGKASWEDLVRQNIFKPLHMHSSGFNNDDHGFENFALPYITVNGQLVNISKELIMSVNPAGPAGSVFSTAEDMAKWIRFHLNISAILRTTGPHSPHIDMMADTYKGQMPAGLFPADKTKPTYPVNDVNIGYAFGWVNSNYRGYRKIWHSGGLISYTSGLWLFPDVDAGLFFSVSGPLDRNKRYVTQEIGYYAADLLLGETSWLNISTACKFPLPFEQPETKSDKRSSRKQGTSLKPKRPLLDYTGIYGHLAFGNITVSLSDTDKNALKLRYGRFGEMMLKFTKEPDTFEATYIGPLWYIMGGDDGDDPITIKFRSHANQSPAILTLLDYPITVEKPSTFVRGLRLDDRVTRKIKDRCTSNGSKHFISPVISLFLLFSYGIFNINFLAER